MVITQNHIFHIDFIIEYLKGLLLFITTQNNQEMGV